MTKSNLPIKIIGRYFFDMREGWSIFRVEQPFDYEKEECFWCSGSGKDEYQSDEVCRECNGRGYQMSKKYVFRPDDLADFVRPFAESGDQLRITVELIDKPDKPVYLWDGQIKEGKELLKR